MFNWLTNFFKPEVSDIKEKYQPNFSWTIVSKYYRKILKGQKEFKITLDEFDVIRDLIKKYGEDLFAETRIVYRNRKKNYENNPLGGIKDIKIGFDPTKQEAVMYIKMRKEITHAIS